MSTISLFFVFPSPKYSGQVPKCGGDPKKAKKKETEWRRQRFGGHCEKISFSSLDLL
jgi:hypothetical protein